MSDLPPLIDSHCHLDFDYEDKRTKDLIEDAKENGITHLITIGTEMSSLEKLPPISEAHENIYHTLGIHPHDAKTIEKGDLDKIKAASQHKKCVAIGEIGLDYHYDNSPRDIQIKALDEQLDLALDVGLPIVIHARDAEPDLIKALRRYTQKISTGRIPGVIHCFTGTLEFAKSCIDLGFFISFSGIITFKKSEELRETLKALPKECLMVETDSPFLAPIPHRGKKCQPHMVRLTAEKMAEIQGLSIEEISRITVSNTQALFGLGV